jgi:hypothetical protein
MESTQCTESSHTPECQARMAEIIAGVKREWAQDVAKQASAELIPKAVTDAILKAWPDQAVEILGQLRFAGDHYSFTRWGMYVGVEFDGYIHT